MSAVINNLVTEAASRASSTGTITARRINAKTRKDSLEVLLEEQKAVLAEREQLEIKRNELDQLISDCDVRIQAYAASLDILRRKL